MSLRSLRGAFTPNQRYVCLHCRLQYAPTYLQRVLRKQHTSSESIHPSEEAFLSTTLEIPTASATTDVKSQKKSKQRSKPLRKASTKPPKSPKLARLESQNAKDQEDKKAGLPMHQYKLPILRDCQVNDSQRVGKHDEDDLSPADSGHHATVQKKSRKKRRSVALPTNSHQEEQEHLEKKATASLPQNSMRKLDQSLFQDTSTGENPQNKELGVSKKNKDKAPKAGTKRGSKTGKTSKRGIRRVVSGPLAFRKLATSGDRTNSQKIRRIPTDVETKETMTAAEILAAAAENIDGTANWAARRKGLKRKLLGVSSDESDVISSVNKLSNRVVKINAKQLKLNSIRVDQPPVPSLSYGLERVLFNRGVYQLQDLRSRVFNFDPYLQTIMPVTEFDFKSLKEYITSSADRSLSELAQKHKRRYVGSSSSMTGVLSHFHYLLSQWRDINIGMLSKEFPDKGMRRFTLLQRSPSAIFLRWKDGIYAIDADKEFATANVLSMLGKSMEKLLTLDTLGFERYRKSNPDQVSSEERSVPETFHYSTMGDFLMRAQLDAYDPRLPGTGTFDLKTRAVVAIRMDTENYTNGTGYEIKTSQGEWESYEREYFDMIRAAFLKYSLQVRMGKMDGIFVAFHNVERIFGFQYVTLSEMDEAVHSHNDTTFGDQEFKLSLNLMNKVLDRATKKYPNTSLRIHFETRDTQTNFMYIFAEPMTEEQVKAIQSKNNAKIEEFEQSIFGLHEDKAQENETGWADIEASVQEAMDEDEMSLIDPEKLNDANFDSETRESSVRVSHEDDIADSAVYGRISEAETSHDPKSGEEEIQVLENCRKEAIEKDVEDQQDLGAGDRGPGIDFVEEIRKDREKSTIHNAEETASTGEGEDIEETDVSLGEESNMHDHQDANQSMDVVRDENTRDIEDSELETTGIEHESSAAKNVEPAESADQHLEVISDHEDHLQAHPNGDFENLGAIIATSNPESEESDAVTQQSEKLVQPPSSNADVPFLESIEAEHASDVSNIFAMTLTIRNKVDGKYISRPDNLKPDQKWEVEYSLAEVTNQSRASILYKACQLRRKKYLDFERDDDENNNYLNMLKKMSQQGASWRKQMDKQDVGKPRVVLTESTVTAEEHETGVEDVENETGDEDVENKTGDEDIENETADEAVESETGEEDVKAGGRC